MKNRGGEPALYSTTIVLRSKGYRRSLGLRMKQKSNTEVNPGALTFCYHSKMMNLY